MVIILGWEVIMPNPCFRKISPVAGGRRTGRKEEQVVVRHQASATGRVQAGEDGVLDGGRRMKWRVTLASPWRHSQWNRALIRWEG